MFQHPVLFDLTAMKQQLAALDAQRAPLAALIAAAESYQASLKEKSPAGVVAAYTDPESGTLRRIRLPRKGPVTLQTVQLALEMANVYETPVTTAEIVAEMRTRGLPLPDKGASNIVSARLSNSDELEGRRGLGWWPKGKPWPNELNGLAASNKPDDRQDGGADVSSTA